MATLSVNYLAATPVATTMSVIIYASVTTEKIEESSGADVFLPENRSHKNETLTIRHEKIRWLMEKNVSHVPAALSSPKDS